MPFGALVFLWQWWRQIAVVALLAGVLGYHWNAVRLAEKRGHAECVQAASVDMDRRIKNALEADKRAGAGATGGRLLDNDGFRRD